MEYAYKFVPISQWLTKKQGEDTMEDALARYISGIVEEEIEDGWEYYRTDSYKICEQPGCLASFFGAKEIFADYNLLVFRKEIK